jgi:hypothetical protein
MPSRFNLGKMSIRTRYEKVPNSESQSSSPLPLFSSKSWGHKVRQPTWANRLPIPRMSIARLVALVSLIVFVVAGSTGFFRHRWHQQQRHGEEKMQYHWEHYPR